MWENKIVRCVIYVVAGSIISEVVYSFFTRVKKSCNNMKKCVEVNDVLLTNELSQVCNIEHTRNSNQCKSKYCYMKNVNRIVELINSARYTIDFAMYIFTANEPADAIIRAHKRGVKVRVIGDESMCYASGSQLLQLHIEGIPIRFQPNTSAIMHHKFCVIDSPKSISLLSKTEDHAKEDNPTGILLTGSMNWTYQAFSSNWDNMMITTNDNLVESFASEFQRMWLEFNIKNNLLDDSLQNKDIKNPNRLDCDIRK